MTRGLDGRRWLLLLGMGLILLVVVGLLFYGRLAGLDALPAVTGLASYGITARQALAPAAELAVQWQADARLAVASCYRPAVGRQPEDEIEWAFQFFSPATQRLALITVTSGEARVVRESLSPYMMPTFSTDQWPVDSDQALQVWWDRGGGTVLQQRPDADLAMELRMSDEGGEYPIWVVVGLVGGADNVFVVRVNATEGVVVGPR